MDYKGDFLAGVTVYGIWNSNGADGASITRATNGTISVYKNSSTTQTTTGVTDTEDFDSLTGVHLVAIDTSSDGTFYAAGNDFHVVLSAATIDGKTVNAVLFSFSLENRNIKANVTQFGGSAGTFASGRPEVNMTHIAGSAVSTTTAQIGVNVVQISTDATAADNLEAMLDGTGGVTLTTAMVGNITGNLSGSVGSVTTVNDKTGYRLSATGVDDVWDEVQSGHTTAGTFGKYVDAQISSVGGGSAPTAAQIADAVWDETASDHVGAGSTGYQQKTLQDAIKAKTDLLTTMPSNFSLLSIDGSGRVDISKIEGTDATNQLRDSVLTQAMTESYAADGAAPTLAQAVFWIMQGIHEFELSGTVGTVKKIDGSTTAGTFAVDSASSPTSRWRTG